MTGQLHDETVVPDLRGDPLWPAYQAYQKSREVRPFSGEAEWETFKAGAAAQKDMTRDTFARVISVGEDRTRVISLGDNRGV